MKQSTTTLSAESVPKITSEFLRGLSQQYHLVDIQSAIEQFAKENNGANLVNEQDEDGRTLSHYVAFSGH